MASPIDTSEGARELVDLNAESIGHLGTHLAQIGDIISLSVQPPVPGRKRTSVRVSEKLELYKKYTAEVERRKQAIDEKIKADFERLAEWRKQAGTEGASMVEELQAQYDKIRTLNKELETERENLEAEKVKVADLTTLGEVKDKKISSLIDTFIQKKMLAKDDSFMRAGVSSWLQCSFDNIRFKWKAQEEKERLRILHHQKMRKARAQARIDTIQREREKRQLQACFLAIQEECVECRNERHLFELRQRHDDELLILHAQLAQALGDEEQAKELVAEQVRRMEEARRQAREAERAMKQAQKEAYQAKADAEQARKERDEARDAEAKAIARADAAEADAAEARAGEAKALEGQAAADMARAKAEREMRAAEDQVKKKLKKIANLQRMIAELGAESDSDAPPDERPPAFFVNEDGSKVPRPRTRKERMGMAYREAESSRIELRLGMAAMIDKDMMHQKDMLKLARDLHVTHKEVSEVRWANKVLTTDLQEAVARAAEAEKGAEAAKAVREEDPNHMVLNGAPLAASNAAASPFSPTRPTFGPASLDMADSSPRFLLKAASQPILMPDLTGDGTPKGPEKITLAPLRKLKRPPLDWRVSWH